jgi:hypothetical protein
LSRRDIRDRWRVTRALLQEISPGNALDARLKWKMELIVEFQRG